MIYLYGSGSWEGSDKYLKIGYASSVSDRMKPYVVHNPFGKLLATREGTGKTELKLHLRLDHLRVQGTSEWFEDCDEVISVFSSPEETLDSWLWENRGTVFYDPWLPPLGTLKREILDEITEKYERNIPDT